MLLRTIDSLWVEHLTEVDDMRRGIGLRGYAQQDPLNEFRKEAYQLYEELSSLIQHQVASTIFRVTVKREPATVPLPGPGQPALRGRDRRRQRVERVELRPGRARLRGPRSPGPASPPAARRCDAPRRPR